MARRLSPLVVLILACLLADLSVGFSIPKVPQTKAYMSIPKVVSTSRCTARPALLNGAVGEVAHSLFRSQGQVPFLQAFGLNAFLFTALSPKLFTMLTPTGFAHAFVLGTLLWKTIGWKGWTLCVLYLFFGQAVTKVKFAEKEKKGIAESRGGRRGPGGVW